MSLARKAWLVTGASRGMGRALVSRLSETDAAVIATARDPVTLADLPSDVLKLPLNVRDPAAARDAVKAAVERFGGVDVLVNNAGYALLGAFEEVSDAQIREQMETNFFGVLEVTREVLPLMRRARAGHIINVSSYGGELAAPGLSAYNASKFAVEGFSEALAQEVAPLGIKVTLVQPGAFRTDWAGPSLVAAPKDEAYAEGTGWVRQWMSENAGRQPGDPSLLADILIRLAHLDEPPLRLAVGADAHALIERQLTTKLDNLARWRAVFGDAAFPPAHPA